MSLSGPLLVLAGAGTGKTRVVTYRIAELIRRGIRPPRILAVTFTNKAAREMQERAAALLGKRRDEKVEISTFHSLCVRIFRRNARHLGYPDTLPFTIGAIRRVSRGRLYGRSASAMACSVPETWPPHRPMEDGLAATRTSGGGRRNRQGASCRRCVSAVPEGAQAAGAVDFDDLLLCTEDLFAGFPAVRGTKRTASTTCLVDEYQDTNGSQYRIVKAPASGHRNLCVVGNDDQSIYGWRATT